MTNREIEKLAAKILEQAGVERLPVHLSQLAEGLDVTLLTYRQYAEATGISQQEIIERFGPDGFTEQVGSKTVIFYCNRGNIGRMRWTLAHELAHVMLGHLSGRRDGEAERQADSLAAELLCPRGVVELCGCRHSSELARLCDISQTAAGCRYRELWQQETPAPIPGTMIGFLRERQRRPDEMAVDERMPRLRSRRL